MFTKLIINDFRALKDKTIKLGAYATMLAGWNATGKSTILALLANFTQSKDEKHLFTGKILKADFSEIINGSQEFDKSGSDKAELFYKENNSESSKKLRVTWQTKPQSDEKRFRLIPYSQDNDSKFGIPVIYLGLSRLFPVGETEENERSDVQLEFPNDEIKEWFIDEHKKILSYNSVVQSVQAIDLRNMRKKASGVNTDDYDWRSNSSGQDNVGQILQAVATFKELKKKETYKGGLLLIDEIEASLHPKAQEYLLNLLIAESKKSNFQIVFTTHSTFLIKKFAEKNKGKNSFLFHYYFTWANGNIELDENPLLSRMEDDLLVNQVVFPKIDNKIIVFAEDDEARWFIKNLLKTYKKFIKLPNVKLGCSNLMDLMNNDPSFSNRIVIFDGDVTGTKNIRKYKRNYLILPSTNSQSPEKELKAFIDSPLGDDYLNDIHKKNSNLKREYFGHNFMNSHGDGEREKYKNWFILNKPIFDKTNIFKYWREANVEISNKFVERFEKIYNSIAKKIGAEIIEK